VLMTAAVTDELSRLPHTKACCRRAEMIALLRFAGAVHREAGRIRIEVDLDTPLVARRLGAAIRALYGYPPRCRSCTRPGTPPDTGCGWPPMQTPRRWPGAPGSWTPDTAPSGACPPPSSPAGCATPRRSGAGRSWWPAR